MVAIVKNADGEIVTYYERGDDVVLEVGQTLDEDPRTFVAYAERLVLSAGGRSGESLQYVQSNADVLVDVSCVECAAGSVDIVVNELIETVAIDADGNGQIALSAAVAGRFVLGPAERTVFCAGGEASLTIDIVE